MVERIGNGSSLVREAVLAALERQSKQGAAMRELASELTQSIASPSAEPGLARVGDGEPASFTQRLEDGLAAVDREVRAVDELPAELLSGRIEDFHEVAVQLKKAEFSFRFAMEVRNKLIDAYREVMRMSV